MKRCECIHSRLHQNEGASPYDGDKDEQSPVDQFITQNVILFKDAAFTKANE
jgi:hypothetical protein